MSNLRQNPYLSNKVAKCVILFWLIQKQKLIGNIKSLPGVFTDCLCYLGKPLKQEVDVGKGVPTLKCNTFILRDKNSLYRNLPFVTKLNNFCSLEV